MTRERIAAGLELLVLQIANDADAKIVDVDEHGVPKGWKAHEWSYVKGIASAAIYQWRNRLVAAS